MVTPGQVQAEQHLRWSMNARESTPYLVDTDVGGSKQVYNLRNGEVGWEVKGFGTIQTGQRTDPTMDMLLTEPDNEVDGDD